MSAPLLFCLAVRRSDNSASRPFPIIVRTMRHTGTVLCGSSTRLSAPVRGSICFHTHTDARARRPPPTCPHPHLHAGPIDHIGKTCTDARLASARARALTERVCRALTHFTATSAHSLAVARQPRTHARDARTHTLRVHARRASFFVGCPCTVAECRAAECMLAPRDTRQGIISRRAAVNIKRDMKTTSILQSGGASARAR